MELKGRLINMRTSWDVNNHQIFKGMFKTEDFKARSRKKSREINKGTLTPHPIDSKEASLFGFSKVPISQYIYP